LLANHLSWLDILVLAGATGSAFVAKAELGRGFVGWLADLNSTIYVSRSARNSARNQAQEIGRALEGDQPVTLFPEGTTGAGDRLLPFRSTLLEAAVGANREVTVRPAVIDYGKAAREIAWHEESGRDNILRLLGRRGTIPVRIRLCPPLPPCGDRKLLARQAHAAIERALAASDSFASRL
jgi:1-acyl-sn-glycerol-3-phosphate acyltransferase